MKYGFFFLIQNHKNIINNNCFYRCLREKKT
jgi:hypothetical protein